MKKLIIGLLVFVIVAAVGIYLGAGFFLGKVSRIVLDQIAGRAGEFGVEITEAEFSSIALAPLAKITWNGISIKGRRVSNELVPTGPSFSVSVGKASVQLEDFSKRTFRLKAKNVNAVLNRNARTEEDHLIGTDFETAFEFDFTNPKKAVASGLSIARDLAMLFVKGRCLTFVRFEGRVRFTLNEKQFDTGVVVKQVGDESVLVMDRVDLKEISREFTEELTDAEIEIISEHPLRAPELLRITKQAYRTADEAHNRNPAIPEDACRHVFWSYFLTRAYGPEFAKRVTDAHEQGGIDEIEADHAMDLNNNVLGREYALQNYTEAQVLQLVQQDSRVIYSKTRIRTSVN